jgi:dolichyl-phosphate-mannose-protein mannosyltransferase
MYFICHDMWKRLRVTLCAVLVTVVSFWTYVAGYDRPKALFWDENFHIAAAQHYLNGHFFMEPHPPLGKLLIALGEYALAPNERRDQFRDTDHGNGSMLPEGFSFAGYRLIPTLLAWLAAPLLFLTAWLASGHLPLALLTAALYTFDNAIIVHSRGAMLEGPQLFFIATALLAFFALLRDAVSPRCRIGVAAVVGIALGAAVATKVNSLVFTLLLPSFFFFPMTLKKRAQLLATALGSLCVIYVAVWYVHFSIAQERNPKLKEDGYHTTDQSIRAIIDKGERATPRELITLMRYSAVNYFARYEKGVAALDLCKTGENGSAVFMWPFGARTIQYRWETADDNKARYLYLVANPFGWLIALIGMAISLVLLASRLLFPDTVKVKHLGTITLFVALYVSYLAAMSEITRVLYLYHYLLPLIVAFLLCSVAFREVAWIGPIAITERRRTGFAFLCIGLTALTFLWYSPLTYYNPLSDHELRARALLPMWDLKCVGCPRTNRIASGGQQQLYRPRFAVSGVRPTELRQGWGQSRLGVSVTGKPIEVGGIAYPDSFGLHSEAVLTYPVSKRFSRVQGFGGLPDYQIGSKASVRFIVEGDGKVLWQSPVVKAGDPIMPIDIDISGISTLQLKIDDAQDGKTDDHGFLANLTFEP